MDAQPAGCLSLQAGRTEPRGPRRGERRIAGHARRLVGRRSRLSPLRLPRQSSPPLPAQQRRFSGGVAVCPCSFTLTADISGLRDSEHSAFGRGAGDTSPAYSTPQKSDSSCAIIRWLIAKTVCPVPLLMSTTAPPPPKKPRRTKNAKLKGAAAIAQGKKAKAAGMRGARRHRCR
jgi:hypothetical protein